MTSFPPPPPAPPLPPPSDQPVPVGLAPLPDPPVRPPLRRSRTDKMLGGVAGGLAEYSGIDALLWRVGFVALTLAGGSGVLVYLLLWLLVPAGSRTGPAHDPCPKAPAGPRSAIPGITVAGLLIVVGTLVLVSRFTDWSIGPQWILGPALLVVGLGLVAAAFAGGRRAKGGLIALGAVLSLALMVASAEPWDDADDGIGDRTFRPAAAEDVPPVYSAGFGDVTLDLSGIDLDDLDGPVTTRLEAGVGDVEILVPRSADVRVEIDRGIGDVEVFGTEGSDGGLFAGQGSADRTGDGEPEIALTIDAGLGDVEVSRA